MYDVRGTMYDLNASAQRARHSPNRTLTHRRLPIGGSPFGQRIGGVLAAPAPF